MKPAGASGDRAALLAPPAGEPPSQASWLSRMYHRARAEVGNPVLRSVSFEERSGDLRFVQDGASQVGTVEHRVSQTGTR
jgi:hypothetical protein